MDFKFIIILGLVSLLILYIINEFKLLKSIKFIRYPDIIQIYKQIELLSECIIKICKET